MSWISGTYTIKDLSEKSLSAARAYICNDIRSNSNLNEFPHMGESCMPIRDIHHGKIFPSEEAAREYADSNPANWMRHANIVLAYRTAGPVTKEVQKLVKQVSTLRGQMWAYAGEHGIKSLKAAFISCPKCGSRLSRQHLHGDFCPLCQMDLRSKTTKKALARYEERVKEKEEQLRKAREEAAAKSPVAYLVCYQEYVG